MDGLLWAAGYELKDFGNTISVSCLLDNTSSDQAKTILLDWVLVIDGQEYLPNNITTLGRMPPASFGVERTIPAYAAEILFVNFDTPPGRDPNQEAKTFMQDKDVMILWPSFNTQLKIELK